MKMRTTYASIAVSLAAMFTLTGHAAGQGWGNIKGQAVWAGVPPAPAQIKVDKDQAHCLSKGAIVNDILVVDPKTNGVRNVMVWLAPLKAGDKLPIHPSLKAVPKDK